MAAIQDVMNIAQWSINFSFHIYVLSTIFIRQAPFLQVSGEQVSKRDKILVYGISITVELGSISKFKKKKKKKRRLATQKIKTEWSHTELLML